MTDTTTVAGPKNAMRWTWAALSGAVGWAVVGSAVLWHVIDTLEGRRVPLNGFLLAMLATAPIAAPLGMLHGAWRAPNAGLTGSAFALLGVLPMWWMMMSLGGTEYPDPVGYRREFVISIGAALLAGFCAGAVTARLTRVLSTLMPWTKDRAVSLLALWATLALFELIICVPGLLERGLTK